MLKDTIKDTIKGALQACSLFLLGMLCYKFVIEYKDRHRSATEASARIKELDRFSDTLTGLRQFVDSQRKSIEEQQQILHQLESRRTALAPIVTADRTVAAKIVAATMDELEEKKRRDKWRDQLEGFCLGVLSSIVASLMSPLFRR